MLLFYFITVQTSFRKISLAMLIITIFLAIIGIKSLRSVKYLNYLIFISLIVLVHFHGKLILEKKEYSFFKNDSPSFFVGTTFPVPINIIPNPHNTVIDKNYHNHNYTYQPGEILRNNNLRDSLNMHK